MSNVITLVPDDAELYAIAQTAAADGRHLISNGDRFALSPVIPAGWHAMPVGDKSGQLRRAA